MKINRAQYAMSSLGSPGDKVAAHQRRKMYSEFLKASAIDQEDTLLDVGATGDRLFDHSNYLVAWYPFKQRVTAVGLDDPSQLRIDFPGVKPVRADGLFLPFRSSSYDWVHSSAVLEHVGNDVRQAALLAEMFRVARKGIFVTTPNRWFPIEFHTALPLLHWLPKRLHRRILNILRLEFFANEENLNLLSKLSLLRCAKRAAIATPSVITVRLLLWPTNLLLIARKATDAE